MQSYPTIQNYSPYPPMPQPYPDRLTQLQNQYQQLVNNPQVQQMSVPAPQVNQGLLWVQGEAGAKSYLVAPNTTVLLMDSESQRFYLKSTDNSGIPSLRIFEYTEVSQSEPQGSNTNEMNLDGKYVTREEYEGLKRQYERIKEQLNTISANNSEVEQSSKSTKSRGRGGSGNEQSDI